MQSQHPRTDAADAITRTLRVGDQARYIIVKNTPQMAHVFIKDGLIVKIENRRATLKLPGGQASTVFVNCLSPRGPSHPLTRALSGRSRRTGRRCTTYCG